MSEHEKKHRIGNGLPCCIGSNADGFERLKNTLGLLNRDHRKALLESPGVKDRIRVLRRTLSRERLRPGVRDHRLLSGLYSDPNFRRELWSAAYNRTMTAENEDQSQMGIPRIPSLEHCILVNYIQKRSSQEESRIKIEDVFSKWPDLVQYLKDGIPWSSLAAHAWSDVLSDLDRWDVLNDERHKQTILISFAVATITDDERILLSIVRKIPELKAEFDDVLNDGNNSHIVSDSIEEEDALIQWNSLCVQLKILVEKAAGPPPVVDAFAEITDVVGRLKEIEQLVRECIASPSFEDLMLCLNRYIGELKTDQIFTWLDGGLCAQLHARWQEAQQSLSPKQLKEEINRLNVEAITVAQHYRQLSTTLSDTTHQRNSLHAEEPRDFASHHTWEERLDELGKRILILNQEQRQARLALLSQLSPLGTAFELLQDYTNSSSPQDKSESSPTSPKIESVSTTDMPRSDENPIILPTSTTDRKRSTEQITKNDKSKIEPAKSLAPLPLQKAEYLEPEETTAVDSHPTLAFAMERMIEALLESPPRIAYVVQVGRLINHLGLPTNHPPIELFEATLLSDYLHLPDGIVADELRQILEQYPPPEQLSHGSSRDLYVMLALAGTLRPALLAPQSGALAFLTALKPSEQLGSVYRFADAIGERCQQLQGVRIDSTVLRGVSSDAIWEAEREKLILDAKEWKTHALHRTIKYAPATKVWQKWLRPNGLINQLMTLVVSGASGENTSIKEIIAKLEDRKNFEDLVRRTDRVEIGRRRGQDIHASALDQLYANACEAVKLAHRHISLCISNPSQSDFLIRALAELRERADELAPSASEELRNLVDGKKSLFSGVANVAAYAIDRFRQFFDPHHMSMDRELNPNEFIASGLFGFPSLHIDDNGVPEGDPQKALTVLLSTGQPEALVETFEKYLDTGDLGTSRRIVSWIKNTDPHEASKLQSYLDERLRRHTNKLHNEIDETRTRIEIALVRGYISDAARITHDAVLVELERRLAASQVRRFDLEKDKLYTIISKINEELETQKEKIEAELENLMLPKNSTEYKELSNSIAQGDIVTAYEFMDRIRSTTSPIPSEKQLTQQRKIFEEFYPGRLRAIEKALEESNNSKRVITQIDQRTEFAGMMLGNIPGAQRKSAVQMLEAWFSLKRTAHLHEKSDETVTTLFSGLGFIVRKVTITRIDRNLGEARIETDPLHVRERCPIPAFGSFANGQYRLVFLWGRPTEEDILQHADERSRKHATIILYFGRLSETRRESLARIARERFRTFLILDELLLVFLCGERDSRMPPLFACALPFTYVQPYLTTAGSVPPEMFYGREKEIQDVADPNGTVFIYGGRQLGKTALLRAVERTSHKPKENSYAIWIDLKGVGIGYDRDASDIWPTIWRSLLDLSVMPDKVKEPNPNIRGRIDDFVDYLCSYFSESSGRTLLLLLDEADKFLEVDARDFGNKALGYRESSRLKSLMDKTLRSIKVVFAGLHNVLRTVESANHPLGHFGQPIQVGPLLLNDGWRAAEALVRQPLLASGYRFEHSRLVTRILAQTNYYPSLIQLYGSALIKAMCSRQITGAPLYDIDGRMLDEIYQDTNLREMIRSRFHLTLQLDPRYEVIAYTIASECIEKEELLAKGIDHRQIDETVRIWWPQGFEEIEPYTDGFRSLLDEMVGLGVLRITDDDRERYTLRNPNVFLLMGTDDEIVDNLLRNREPPQEFERELFRARDPRAPDGPFRNPLTFKQEDLLRAERNGVSLICGLPASGFEDVLPFLKARRADDSVIELGDLIDHREFEKELQRRDRQRPEGTTLYMVPANVPWGEKWMQVALRRIEQLRAKGKYVQIVFMADPGHLWQLMPELERLNRERLQWISLRPWRKEFLRQWMADVGFVDDPDMRDRIAKQTGGWWVLIKRLYELEQETGNLEASFEELKQESGNDDVSRQLKVFGLDGFDVKNVLRYLADLGEATFKDLQVFVDDEGIDSNILERSLKWAELLHLARRTGPNMWKLDQIASDILSRVDI